MVLRSSLIVQITLILIDGIRYRAQISCRYFIDRKYKFWWFDIW